MNATAKFTCKLCGEGCDSGALNCDCHVPSTPPASIHTSPGGVAPVPAAPKRPRRTIPDWVEVGSGHFPSMQFALEIPRRRPPPPEEAQGGHEVRMRVRWMTDEFQHVPVVPHPDFEDWLSNGVFVGEEPDNETAEEHAAQMSKEINDMVDRALEQSEDRLKKLREQESKTRGLLAQQLATQERESKQAQQLATQERESKQAFLQPIILSPNPTLSGDGYTPIYYFDCKQCEKKDMMSLAQGRKLCGDCATEKKWKEIRHNCRACGTYLTTVSFEHLTCFGCGVSFE